MEGIYFWLGSFVYFSEFDRVNISAILDVVCNFNFSLLTLALGDVFDIRASMQTKNTRNFSMCILPRPSLNFSDPKF